MHRHARQWPRPPWFTRFRWDYGAAFGAEARWGRWQDGIGVGPAECQVLARLDSALKRRLAAFGTGPERFGLVHADTRLANLLVHDGAVSVIDFDDSGFSWYLYDLGTSVSFFEHEPSVPGLIDSWLTGYRAAATLTSEDEAEIWTFVLFRRLLLVAWIGSHRRVDIAAELGAGYTRDSCDLAEWYLTRHLSTSGSIYVHFDRRPRRGGHRGHARHRQGHRQRIRPQRRAGAGHRPRGRGRQPAGG
jgi:Ser/Thr protein kinase RdoA (MazF antagonist)